MSSVTV